MIERANKGRLAARRRGPLRPAAVESLELRAMMSSVEFAPSSYPAAGYIDRAIAGDFNGDGKADVATSTGQLFVGNGDGAFQAPVNLGGLFPANPPVDLNADGKLDLFAAGPPGWAALVQYGLGGGRYAAVQPVGAAPAAAESTALAAGDFNGDGRVDLIAIDRNAGTARAYLRTADGTYAAAASYSIGGQPYEVCVADFDGDGRADAAVANVTQSALRLLFGNADGTFRQSSVAVPGVSGHTDVTAGDLNGDGRPDLAFTNLGYGPGTALNLGGGTFGPAARYEVPGGNSYFVEIGNFTNDGRADLLSAPSVGSFPGAVLTGSPTGTLGLAATEGVAVPAGPVALADFDGDGLTDLAAGANNYLFVFAAQRVVARGAALKGYHVSGATVATFSDNLRPADPLTTVTATVAWGDGRTTPGTVVADGPGSFHVVATHDFPYNRSYLYTVTATLADGRTVAATGTADVNDAPPGPTVTEFPAYGGGTYPDHLVAGAGGDLWFTSGADYQSGSTQPRPAVVGRVSAASGAVSYVSLPSTLPGGRSLAADGGGNAWVVVDAARLGRVDAATGALTFYPLAVAPAGPLARGADGAVYFRVAGGGTTPPGGSPGDRLARVQTAGPSVGAVTFIPLDKPLADAADMTVGPDGNFWVARGTGLARVTPAGAVTDFVVGPPAQHPDAAHVAAGPDGNLWFTLSSDGYVGRMTPAGVYTLFKVPSNPVGIVAGPDGAMWYTGFNRNKIGRITTAGIWSEYDIPTKYNGYPGYPNTGTYPVAAAVGGDGNVWFAEMAAAQLGRVNLAQAAVLSATPVTAARKGVPFTGEVARFTDATPGAADDYAAAIDWGDGTTSAGTLVPAAGGYVVNGTHTYAAEGVRTVTVTLTPWADVSVTAATTAAVDYPLEPVTTYVAFGTEGRSTDAIPLFTFRDPDPDGSPGPFTAIISWGDGTSSTVSSAAGGIVAGTGPGLFDVRPAHAYAREGTYAVTVTVNDVAAKLTAATTARVAKALVTQPPAGYDTAAAGLVAVGDFDGDGKADVASAGPAGGRVDVLRGAGQGVLTQAQTAFVLTGGAAARALAAADFNRDGRTDLAVGGGAGAAGQVSVYLGNADGTFAAAGTFAAPAGALAVADFNKDGRPDLVAGGPEAAGLVVALGDGAGGFAAAAVDGVAGPVPSLALADFDKDGTPDFAIGTAGSTAVRVFRGNGDGTFAVAGEYAGLATSGTAYLAAGDLSGDGAADLAVADVANNALYVLTNTGSGTLTAAAGYRLDEAVAGLPPGAIAGLVAADVNADGVADLVRASRDATPEVNVRLGQGAGAYRPVQTDFRYPLALPAVPPAPGAVVAADVNGDGRVDLVASAGGRVVVLLNTPFTVVATARTLTEGVADPTLVLGRVTRENPPATAAGLTAAVDWGDGSSSAVALVPNGAGGLDVVGGHAYRRAGSYTAVLAVTNAAGLRAAWTTTLTVANAAVAVTGKPFAATVNAAVTAVVATFADANPASDLADFSATIDWGNGRTTAGIVRADPAAGAGRYTVTGTQTYAAPGTFAVKVTVTDSAAPSTPASGTATATVKPIVNGGGSVGGGFFNDLNFDGAKDAGEPPLFAWTAYVDANNNGAFDAGEPSALSSSAGAFVIADVGPGTWTVRQVVDPLWRATAPADPAAGVTVTVTPGQQAGGVTFLDTRRPTVLVEAGAAVRASALDAAVVRFSEPVAGFDLADLTLTRDGVSVPLTAGGGVTLATADNLRFTVGGLAALTAAPGGYTLAVAAGGGVTDLAAHPLAVGASGSFTVAPPAGPALLGVTVGDGTAQRSQVRAVTLRFDRPVTLAAGALTLARWNAGGSGADDGSAPTNATAALAAPTSADGGLTWVYTFAAGAFTEGGGSLKDGVYTLTLDPAKVAGAGGPSAAGSAVTFHRLFGDQDGNGVVNNADYVRFRAAFGSSMGSAAYNALFDYDGNGVVNNADYLQFRSRFGKAFTYT